LPHGTRLIIAAGIVVAGACAHRPATSIDAEQDRVEQRQTAFLAALAARDADGVAVHFAPDAVLHVANMPAIHGREAIGTFYGNVFRFMAASQATPETPRVAANGDMAWSAGRVVNAFQSPQGTTEFTGKYLLVWERREAEWQIVVYAVSNDADAGSR
jgi:ketosteroid isomerase-like protein